jgi:hypothetical protein
MNRGSEINQLEIARTLEKGKEPASVASMLMLKVFSVSLIASIVVAVIFGALVVVTTTPSALDLSRDGIDILGTLLAASLPVSMPLGIVGGAVALWALRHPTTLRPRRWVRQGAIAGVVIGSAGSAAAAAAFSTVAAVWAVYCMVGALAGVICGALVGLWIQSIQTAQHT